MSTEGKDISPGRARAEALGGSNIESEKTYMAPDGHPAGPGADQTLATKAVPPLGSDAAAPKATRPSPVTRK